MNYSFFKKLIVFCFTFLMAICAFQVRSQAAAKYLVSSEMDYWVGWNSETQKDELKLSYGITYTYDKKGNLKASTGSFYDGGKATDITSTIYTRNKKGQITKVVAKSDYSRQTTTYIYKNGKLYKETFKDTYLASGYTEGYTSVYSYNKQGKVSKIVTKGSSLYARKEYYKYDKKGNVTEYKSGDYKGIYTYDKKGRLSKYSYSEPSINSSGSTTYFYKKSVLYKTIEIEEDDGSSDIITGYNTGGKAKGLPKYKLSEISSEKYTYSYTFDKAGNLLQKIEKNAKGEITEKIIYTYRKK